MTIPTTPLHWKRTLVGFFMPEKNDSKITFEKQAFTIDQHIVLLKRRGLLLEDESRVRHYLCFIGYYRLSGYFLPFQIPGDTAHTFYPGTTFDQVLQTYIFDRKLRRLVMDAVERIEVAARTVISDVMSQSHGAHWYMEKTLFHDKFDHRGLVKRIHKGSCYGEPKKQNLFCRHYYDTYYSPQYPPSWMISEILTAGTWSLIYKGIRSKQDQKTIGNFFGIHPTLMSSWLEAFTDLRNQCAHHGRIWNRTFVKKPKIPKNKEMGKHFRQNSRFAAHAAVLNVFLKVISHGSSWQYRLAELVNTSSHIPINAMGFYDKWEKDPFWGIT